MNSCIFSEWQYGNIYHKLNACTFNQRCHFKQSILTHMRVVHMCAKCAFTAELLAVRKDLKQISIQQDFCYTNIVPVLDAISEIYNFFGGKKQEV